MPGYAWYNADRRALGVVLHRRDLTEEVFERALVDLRRAHDLGLTRIRETPRNCLEDVIGIVLEQILTRPGEAFFAGELSSLDATGGA